MKHCAQCNIEKPFKSFHKKKTAHDGLNTQCKECRKLYSSRYYLEKAEIVKAGRREHYRHNKERSKANSRNYRFHHREELNRKYIEKRQSDPLFKLRSNLRNRLNRSLATNQRTGSAVRDLGCTIVELRSYLESQFLPGMTWECYGNKEGQWSIDHIQPLISFDLTVKEELLKAVHYSNLRPMWAMDNLQKGGKF